MNDKLGVTWFLISYDFEIFCVYGAHWKFSSMIDDSVFDCSG